MEVPVVGDPDRGDLHVADVVEQVDDLLDVAVLRSDADVAAFAAEARAREGHRREQAEYDAAWARYREAYEQYRRDYDTYAAQL